MAMAGERIKGNSEGGSKWLDVLAMQYGFDVLDEALATNTISENEYLLLTDRVSKNRRQLVSLLGPDAEMKDDFVVRDSNDAVIGTIAVLRDGAFRAFWITPNAWGTAVLASVKDSERKIRLEVIRGLC